MKMFENLQERSMTFSKSFSPLSEVPKGFLLPFFLFFLKESLLLFAFGMSILTAQRYI